MISWNEIKDEELRAALGSDYNSDFWQEQDIRELGEKYTFFRRFIAKY